ncbi:putative agglutinin-2-like [Capsicum annuum]|nr:putative agglutinin-2-like [Capsicum annuum]
MTTDSHVHDTATTVAATSVATTSRTSALQAMAPAEKPKKFTGVDFKRNYILSGLQDDLYNVYSGTKTAKELWGALERKYKTVDTGTKKFFVARFLEYKMIDRKSIVTQVQELQVIIHDLIGEGSMMYNGKSRHIKQRYNTVRELLSSGIIIVDYVKSKDNVSDPFTKVLIRERVERTSKGMGLRPRTRNRGKQSRCSVIEASVLRQIQEIHGGDRRLKVRSSSSVRRSLDGVSSDEDVVAPVRSVGEATETVVMRPLFLNGVEEKWD